MFSKKYDLTKEEIKSSLITAIKATIGYFGITITIFYQNLMALNYQYFISIGAFFLLIFSIKIIEKWLRDGDTLNKEFTKEILDQRDSSDNVSE